MRRCSAAAIFFSILGTLAAGLQDNSVADIQAHYASVQAAIQRSVKGRGEGDPGLYSNEVVVNSHKGPWRAVGNFLKKITFWYEDQPDFAVYENRTKESVLLKIEVGRTSAIFTDYEEFLFDRGALVFHFSRRTTEGGGPAEEKRFYFKDGKIVRYMEGADIVAAAPDPGSIFRQAEEYQKLFLATF